MATEGAVEARWEHFPHGADVGVRGIGATLSEAFAQAALALTAVITDPATVRPLHTRRLSCAAPDDEILLVDWLNAVIFEMATHNMLFGRYRVRVDRHALEAEAMGETVDPARHRPTVEVKGATFTGLRVREEGGLWRAECVIDV